MRKKYDHVIWQRDAGTGRFATLRHATEAIVAESKSLGINSYESLVYPTKPSGRDYEWLVEGARVCTLPVKGNVPTPFGRVCVTLIADRRVFLVDDAVLQYKE